jgi:colicin import membrane protein
LATTLYDILEVSASASPESIRASYERLHEHHASLVAGDDDAANRLVALREAYATLSDPALRQAYDRKLAMRAEIATMPEAPPRPLLRTLFVLLVAVACVAGAVKYQSAREQATRERERAAVALRTAELEAQREREERAATERAEAQRRADEASERAAIERERAYARQVSRELQGAEAGANRQAQRAEQQRLAEERQQRYEAERQLAREKAALRRMEAENARSLRY